MSIALLWIVRIVVLLLVLRLLVRRFSRARRSEVGPGARKGALRQGGTLVRDPQCGTYVPRTSPFVEGSGTGAVIFCSLACRDAWRAAHAR